MEGHGAGANERDLVVVALPGVQRFIAEARSTSDVAAASDIYVALASQAIFALSDETGAELVLPASAAAAGEAAGTPGAGQGSEPGMPNRVVALFPAGTGSAAARRASEAVQAAWRGWVGQVFRPAEDASAPGTPGFPCVQWVCVPPDPAGYAAQWHQAQRLLTARRRVRDFAAVPEQDWRRRVLCSLAPRWPAEFEPPPHVPKREQRVPLSAVGWVKRRWRYLPGHEGEGFPSTASIASAPYRRAVIEHLGEAEVRRAVEDLAAAEREVRRALDIRGSETQVPGLPPPDGEAARWLARSGGPWVYPERWRRQALAREVAADRDTQANLERGITAATDAGYEAAKRLGAAMDSLRRRAGAEVVKLPPLASYLAVIVQDLDNMGRFLGGGADDAAGTRVDVSPSEHERVSRELMRVAADQRAELRAGALLGVPVYAGGDDLLAFTPAATALKAAEACHGLIPASLPPASTAVLYFHYHASIQQAMREARDLLERAKHQVRGKHALAVGYLRRSGVSAVSIQPWVADSSSSAELFGIFGRDAEHRLSPRLVADLERDAGELADLAAVRHGPYRAELTRLVRRHTQGDAPGGTRESAGRIAAALAWLGEHEHAPREPGQPAAGRPQAAARVGVFLRQEAR